MNKTHLVLKLSLLFFFSSLIFISCKKTDKSYWEERVIQINNEEKFFTIPTGTSPTVIRIINKVKQQNDQYHFVNDFVKAHGFPKWEFAELKPVKNRNSIRSLDQNGDDTLVYIPVANDVLAKIKDVMACEVNAVDVAIKLIEDHTYKYYGYEPNPEGKATAKDVAAMFMKFEKKVYNHRIFQVPDVELAKKILGENWQDELTHLILKEDPVTNEIGFYRTISVVVVPGVVPMPSYTDMPEIIITTAPGTNPIIFPSYPGLPIGYNGFNWWIDNNYFGTDPNGGSGVSTPGPGNTPASPGIPPGTPSGPGSSNGSQSDAEDLPGWQEPPCGGYWQADQFITSNCSPLVNPFDSSVTTDSIPAIVSRACDKEIDSIFNWGLINSFREQSCIIVKKDENIYPKNFTSGVLNGDKTRVNYTLAVGEILLGYVHTHVVGNDSSTRSFFFV